MLSFNTGDGSYIPAKSVPNGARLSAYMPDVTPTQEGYTFGGWEKIYKTGDESAVLDGGVNATMPAYNVEAKAKWNPANVNYTVLFWYENANDENESYMGSVTRTAPTGSTVSSASFSSYSGVTGASWIDTKHFTYNASNVETEIVKADGSTVLGVHFKRNAYTFTFKDGSKTVYTLTRKYQQDISGEWSFTGTNGTKYPISGTKVTSWTPSGSSTYKARITRMEIMPDENITFTHTTTSNSKRHFIYYVESLGNGVVTYDGKKFDVYLDYYIDFNVAYYNDDFFLLNGYSRYKSTQNGKVMTWTAGKTASMGSSDTLCFYYTRNSYQLTYSVGGSNIDTASVKYDAPLDAYFSYAPADRTDGYTFDGWYKDPECTQSVDALTMPYNNMIVFGKWNPPAHTVTFDVNGGSMSATQTVFEGIPHGGTVSGIADDAGQWLDSYKPVRDNYTFVGWFYGDNQDVRFTPTQSVKADLNLTAVWEPTAATTYADVTIKYVYIDGDGRVPFKDSDGNDVTETRENQAVNSVCVAQAEYFEGYYPLKTLDSVLVVDDAANNVITFVYRKIQTWNYSLEYYAYYRSYETSDVNFKTALGESFSAFETESASHYISTGIGAAYSQYQSVMLTLPEAFKARYHFHHYEYDNETGYDTRATIHPDGNNTAVIKVYLEPDPSLLAVSDRVELYDGNALDPVHGRETLSEFTAGEKTVKAEIMNVYRYFNADGQEQEVKDADAYKMHGYTVLKVDVTQGENTASKYYLLYKDENEGDALNLRIRRRAVTLTSDSDSRPYGEEPLKKDGITVTGDGFAPGEGYNYAFSVEAFRLDVGTSDNSFTYSLQENTKEANYDVTVVFGTLTVT